MKKLRIGIIGVLVVAALLLSLNLIASAIEGKEQENENELKEAQSEALMYKQQFAELEKKFEEMKTEQYVNNQAYEEKINELELKLSAKDTVQEPEITPSDAKYTYTVSSLGVTITGYRGSDKKLYIPQSIDGINVISIGREAFKGATFEEVVLPQGLEKIDWFAFSNCVNLEDIYIPNSVNKIEYGVFDGVNDFEISCSQNSYACKYARSYGYEVEIK